MTGYLTPQEVADMTGVLNVQANAALIKIARPGGTDDEGDPVSPITVWEGEAPALLDTEQKTTELSSNGGRISLSDPGPVTTLTVLDGVAPIVSATGPSWNAWTVTVSDRRTSPPARNTYTVGSSIREAYGLLDSMTLTLE